VRTAQEGSAYNMRETMIALRITGELFGGKTVPVGHRIWTTVTADVATASMVSRCDRRGGEGMLCGIDATCSIPHIWEVLRA